MFKFEIKLLRFLIKRYFEKELDQWELFKIKHKYGYGYIDFTREPTCDEMNYNEW